MWLRLDERQRLDHGRRQWRKHGVEQPRWDDQPDRSVVSLDIPSIGLKLTTHVFESRALEVIDYSASGDPPHVIVALVVPELLEGATG